MFKQAVIYTRFSPGQRGEENLSCEFQEQKCKEYCNYHGLDVLAVYHEKSFTGKHSCKRPSLDKAICRVCSTWEGVLVVYNLARLARSTKEAITITEGLDKYHIDLVIVNQKINTSSRDRNFFGIMSAISDIEIESKGENIRYVLQNMQKNNRRISRYAPYGKMIDNAHSSRLVQNREEIMTIETIMKLYNQGYNYQEICDELTKLRRKPRGKMWYPVTIRRIIANFT